MVLASIGEHGIIFCEHEHFDFLSSTSSEHFENKFWREHRAKKKYLASNKQIKKQFANNEKMK